MFFCFKLNQMSLQTQFQVAVFLANFQTWVNGLRETEKLESVNVIHFVTSDYIIRQRTSVTIQIQANTGQAGVGNRFFRAGSIMLYIEFGLSSVVFPPPAQRPAYCILTKGSPFTITSFPVYSFVRNTNSAIYTFDNVQFHLPVVELCQTFFEHKLVDFVKSQVVIGI